MQGRRRQRRKPNRSLDRTRLTVRLARIGPTIRTICLDFTDEIHYGIHVFNEQDWICSLSHELGAKSLNQCSLKELMEILANSSVIVVAVYFVLQQAIRYYRRCNKNRLFRDFIKQLYQRNDVEMDKMVRARCDCGDRLISHEFSFANIGIVVRCASCRKSCAIVKHMDSKKRLLEWQKVSCYYQQRYWKSEGSD